MRNKLKYIILFVLIAWPMSHMVLSKKGYINSWKFAGWGMYASTNPTRLITRSIFLKDGLAELPSLRLPLDRRTDVLLLGDQKYSNLPAIKLEGDEEFLLKNASASLKTRYSNIKVLNYISLKKKILERSTGESFPMVILFNSERRIDTNKKISYQLSKIYLYRKGLVSYLGTYNSNQLNDLELRNLLNQKIQPAIVLNNKF